MSNYKWSTKLVDPNQNISTLAKYLSLNRVPGHLYETVTTQIEWGKMMTTHSKE